MATAGTWIGNSDAYTCSGANCTELTDPSRSTGYFNTTTGILFWQPKLVNPQFTVTKDETTLTLQITPSGGFTTVEYSLEILRANNWESFAKVENQSGTSSVVLKIGGADGFDVDSIYNFSPTGTNWVGRLITESSIQFQATFTLQRDFDIINNSTSVVTQTSYSATFTSNSSTLSPQDKLIVITEQMPKLKIKDFLNGLFRQFNLTAYVDFNNEDSS